MEIWRSCDRNNFACFSLTETWWWWCWCSRRDVSTSTAAAGRDCSAVYCSGSASGVDRLGTSLPVIQAQTGGGMRRHPCTLWHLVHLVQHSCHDMEWNFQLHGTWNLVWLYGRWFLWIASVLSVKPWLRLYCRNRSQCRPMDINCLPFTSDSFDSCYMQVVVCWYDMYVYAVVRSYR